MKKRFTSVWACLLFALVVPMGAHAQAPSIQEGNILHCFDWKYTDIEAELDNILAAGFTAVQTSPAQANYEGSTGWNTLYRPRDTEIGPNTLGTKEQLKALCAAAHAKGLFVIVDVVANHTDGDLTWVANYWKDTSLYHDFGMGANDGSRYNVTKGNIGMHDLKTEDSRVYSKFKTYIQALKAIGVDGIRWDAAKHIGLPSEGDRFWAEALDKSMFNYGEILNTVGGGQDNQLLPEYMQYMSVTDNTYSTQNVLRAAKERRAPSVAGCYAMQFNTNKVVYWGESHDTYCNRGDESDGVGQDVIDRAYAVAAAHNNIPALYLSRPNGGTNAQAGVKGSTHYTESCVAAVNRFHNAMNGKPDYYTGNGCVASITRKEGGAVVVNFNGAGSVTIANGGGYATPGTYTDAVSGSTWTVTSTTISGQTNGTGVAVLYTDVPSNKASVTLSPATGTSFKTETLSITATPNANTKSAWYQVGTGSKVSFSSPTSFTIGSGVAVGSDITVNWGATNADGEEQTGSATYTKKDPNAAGATINVNSTAGAPYLYVWTTDGATTTELCGKWPGKQMTATNGTFNGNSYNYQASFDEENVNFILNNGQGGTGNQSDNLVANGEVLYSWNGSSASAVSGGSHNGNLPDCVKAEPEGTVYAYFAAPATWTTDVHVWAWTDKTNWFAVWPGNSSEMKEVGTTADGLKVYEWVYTGTLGAPANIIFNNGQGGTGNQTDNLTFSNGGYYTMSGLVVTDIDRVTIEAQANSDDSWYTLTGMRVQQPTQPGFYIHGGKKYLVK